MLSATECCEAVQAGAPQPAGVERCDHCHRALCWQHRALQPKEHPLGPRLVTVCHPKCTK